MELEFVAGPDRCLRQGRKQCEPLSEMPTRFLMCRTLLGLHPRCVQIMYRPFDILPAHKMLRQLGGNLANAYAIRCF